MSEEARVETKAEQTREHVVIGTRAARAVVDRLERAGVDFELIAHRRTATALATARVLGLDPRAFAKTVVLTSPTGFVRTVVPACERVDLAKVRQLVGSDVELASEATLAGAFPDFELGAVPPLARLNGDRVLVDDRLCDREHLYLDAGTHELSLHVRTQDLLLLGEARVGDVRVDPGPER